MRFLGLAGAGRDGWVRPMVQSRSAFIFFGGDSKMVQVRERERALEEAEKRSKARR